MEGQRAPQGLEVEDKLAFGLSATHLAYVVLGLLTAYTIWGSGLPGWLRYPLGALFALGGAAMGWGRFGNRPLDRWAWLAARYWLRPRRSPSPLALAAAAPSVAQRGPAGGEASSTPAEARRAGMHRIAFFGLKGGVGRTTLVAEAAAALAGMGVAVATIDLDLLSPGISTRLGLTDPGLTDAIGAGPDTPIAQFLVRHEPSGIRALLGVLRPVVATHQRRLAVRRALEAMDHLEATGCEVCLVDLGRDIDAGAQQVLDTMDGIYCVFTPAPAAVHALYRTVELLARFGWRRRLALVLNQAGAQDDVSEVVGDLGLPLVAVVAHEASLAAAENDHQPASLHPGAAGRALQPLAAALRLGALAAAG